MVIEFEESMESEQVLDVIERLAEGARVEDMRFPRQAVYIVCAVLSWTALWALAAHNQNNPNAVTLHWVCIFVATWLAYTF